jgi:hypothetical protein
VTDLAARPAPDPPVRRSRRAGWPPWGEPALVLAGSLAACAYISVVDPNKSAAYPQCPTKLLTGLDCPMCGATRAVHSLLRGDLVGAADHNLLFVLLLPVFIYAFVAWTATKMGRPLPSVPMRSKWISIPLAVTLVVFTVLRNLPSGPFHWLNSGVSH